MFTSQAQHRAAWFRWKALQERAQHTAPHLLGFIATMMSYHMAGYWKRYPVRCMRTAP